MKFLKSIGCFLFLPIIAWAQWNTGGEIDNHLVSFGFLLGANVNSFVVHKEVNYQQYTIQSTGQNGAYTSGRLQYITATQTPGFHLGLVSDLHLGDNFNLRFTPIFNFSDRTLAYGYDGLNSTTGGPSFTNPVKKTISSTYVDLPLLLKFRSDRKKNIRAYIIGGIQYSKDLISKSKTDDAGLDPIQKLVKVKADGLSYKVGIGLDLYYVFFKMSPELSISNSLINVLKKENNSFSNPLQSLFPSSVQFTLYFE